MAAKPISLKLPIELLDRLKAKAEADGTNVTALLIAGAEAVLNGAPASFDAHLVPELQAEVASLQAEVKRLRALSVDTVKQAVAKPIAQHAAGPVLPATGLRVRGEARPMFRPGTNADKAAKSG